LHAEISPGKPWTFRVVVVPLVDADPDDSYPCTGNVWDGSTTKLVPERFTVATVAVVVTQDRPDAKYITSYWCVKLPLPLVSDVLPVEFAPVRSLVVTIIVVGSKSTIAQVVTTPAFPEVAVPHPPTG
jgi:hypothetical protein